MTEAKFQKGDVVRCVQTKASHQFDYDPPGPEATVEDACKHAFTTGDRCKKCGMSGKALAAACALPGPPRSVGCAPVGKPDPYKVIEGKWDESGKFTERRKWDCDKHPAPGFWPSLDSRIAAARADLDQGPERRASVARRSKYEPTPWQEWPKGWDDEP